MKKAIVLVTLVLALAACQKKEAAAPAASETSATAAVSTAPATMTDTSAGPAPITVADASVPAQGLGVWLKADAGVTAGPDGAVSEWKSPNNISAKQAAIPEQPKLVPSSIGGKPAIRFDGDKSLLETNLDINPTATPNLTVIAVFDSRTADKSPLRKLYGADDGGYDRAAGIDDRADTNYTIFGGGVVAYFSLEKDKPYITVDEWTPTTFSGWVNGRQPHPPITVSNEHGLPHMFIGGTGTSYHEPWMGDISEMLVYTRTLTDQERTQIEDYLGKKYSVALDRAAAAPTATTTTTAATTTTTTTATTATTTTTQ